jgi:pimeloyl-ACP methyl ester carboxylesterase
LVWQGSVVSAWVLLRGLTREKRHWGDFPEILKRECSGAEVYTIDLPGNGGLNAQESPLRVSEMAESCRHQLRELGIAPPYYVLAMSLGAMVAVAWATRNPDEIGGCVLINTSLRPFSPFHHRLRPQNYLKLASLLLPGCDAHYRESVILQITSNRPIAPEKLAAWSDYARQNPVSSRNALRQLLAAVRYQPPSAKPLPPVLVLCSAQDRLVDARCSRTLAARWQSAFAEHLSAGHDLPLDDAPWVAEQIGRWVCDSTQTRLPAGL